MDGASSLQLFWFVIFPLLRPILVTIIIIIISVLVFNDFQNPLYFMPREPTAQVTLYSFFSRYETHYHLLFTNVLLVALPSLIVLVLFSRKIVAGMTRGAVKG